MIEHNKTDVFRYLTEEITAAERKRVEDHLRECAECSQLLTFAQDFNNALKGIPRSELEPEITCPDASTIAAFAASELDEGTERSVRMHTIYCKDCLEEVFLLRRAAKEAGITTVLPEEVTSWAYVLEKAKGIVIEMGRTYGQGFLLGSAKILAEQLSFAMRGAPASGGTSKVFEVSIGENSYCMEIKIDKNKDLLCDIAGISTPLKEPLRIEVHSEQGEELGTTTSNEYGNCRLTIPGASGSNNLWVFTLTIKNYRLHFALRTPEPDEST